MSEREIVCADLTAALAELECDGFRLDVIYPADDPHTAVLTGNGETVRLTSRPGAPPPSHALPAFAPAFLITRGGGSGEGRAGMLYRDLIPGRLGGRYIASHITIPEGGPVADWVHFHRIALQLIYIRRGWVKLVYEDQGEPFMAHDGDLVLQPPGIRHRVLESSPGLEVIEISSPALHETFADHEMALPTGRNDPLRNFGGQRFVRHIAGQTPWTPFDGAEAQETSIRDATNGLAEARTIRAVSATIAFEPHDGELVFGFVLEGSARLEFGEGFDVGSGDAFVIPPHQAWKVDAATPDFRLLHVSTSKQS